jgi:hypothetical protein
MTEEPASAQDRSTKGIALIPNVSVKTVEAPRRRQLTERLGFRDTARLVRLCT